MIIKKRIYHFIFFIVFCSVIINATAQDVGIRTDRNSILIGERIEYELLITLPSPGYRINVEIPDRIPHFDLLHKGKFDTAIDNGRVSLHQKIIFTSFDSGSWSIPSFSLTLAKNNSFKKYMTDSVRVEVGYSPADSTGQLRDIKPILEVDTQDYFWYYIAGIVLLVLILGLLLFLYLKNRKKKPLPALHSPHSPYDEAIKSLAALSQNRLVDKNEVKQYHTELAVIFLRYYSRISDKNLLNKTTGDFLVELREKQVDTSLIASIAEPLRIGDAVKFAKYIPVVSESRNSLTSIKQAVEYLEKNKTTNQ